MVVTSLISIWVGDFRLVYINSSQIHSLAKQKGNEHASQVSVCWRRSWSLLWATHAEVVILYQTGGNVVTYRLDEKDKKCRPSRTLEHKNMLPFSKYCKDGRATVKHDGYE